MSWDYIEVDPFIPPYAQKVFVLAIVFFCILTFLFIRQIVEMALAKRQLRRLRMIALEERGEEWTSRLNRLEAESGRSRKMLIISRFMAPPETSSDPAAAALAVESLALDLQAEIAKNSHGLVTISLVSFLTSVACLWAWTHEMRTSTVQAAGPGLLSYVLPILIFSSINVASSLLILHMKSVHLWRLRKEVIDIKKQMAGIGRKDEHESAEGQAHLMEVAGRSKP